MRVVVLSRRETGTKFVSAMSGSSGLRSIGSTLLSNRPVSTRHCGTTAPPPYCLHALLAAGIPVASCARVSKTGGSAKPGWALVLGEGVLLALAPGVTLAVGAAVLVGVTDGVLVSDGVVVGVLDAVLVAVAVAEAVALLVGVAVPLALLL